MASPLVWVVVTGQARQVLAQSSTTPPSRQIPPARLSSSEQVVLPHPVAAGRRVQEHRPAGDRKLPGVRPGSRPAAAARAGPWRAAPRRGLRPRRRRAAAPRSCGAPTRPRPRRAWRPTARWRRPPARARALAPAGWPRRRPRCASGTSSPWACPAAGTAGSRSGRRRRGSPRGPPSRGGRPPFAPPAQLHVGLAEGADKLVDLGLQLGLAAARAVAGAAGQPGAAAVGELVTPGRDRGLARPARGGRPFLIDTSPRSTASTMRSFSSTGLTGGRLNRTPLQDRSEAKFRLSQES
jgi:hypothetical protein